MLETGVAVAFAVPITAAILRFLPQRSKDNGYVKQAEFDIQHANLNSSVCRISSEVTALRETFGSELGGVKESISKLSVTVAGMGATNKP